ncbi:MAG: aminoacyl-tRNA hydrolase [Candidatus Cloacimonas sp. 4484_275]|nr:MAG: aminoacyl-tRNA hydrolase [Candidatus Cloacimonas sp. 4484_275]
MKLIVGLGNPGKRYRKNRHNIGFMILDNYAANHELKFKRRLKYNFVWVDDTLLVKPRTFMNNSGNAVLSVLSKYRCEDILVIVDDINLPLGEMRLRRNGSSGGHNGLKSIAAVLGTDNFKRFRIGVGAPEKEILAEYVLSDFSGKEQKILREILNFSETLLEYYIKEDFESLLDHYSRLKKSYSEKIDNLRID